MNKKIHILSVVVPIYNVEKYLQKCVDSIINQTYKDLDIILVDDGSTDSSGKIAEEYKYDSRIKVIHKCNEGLLKARLEGVKESVGEFITFVDADDWVDKDMYSCMMDKVEEKNVDMIWCGMKRFYVDEEGYDIMPLLPEGLYEEKNLRKNVWPQMLWNDKKGTNALNASLCSKIIRKDILYTRLQKSSILDVYYGEDAAVLFPTMLDIRNFYVMHKAFYQHRQREKGNIVSYIQDDECVERLSILYQYLKEQFTEGGYIKLFQRQLDLFYMNLLELRKNYLEYIENKNEFFFPFYYVQANEKVIVYGAGNVGQAYIRQNEKYHFCNVVQWVDKSYQNFDKNLNIVEPEKIGTVDYDCIIIAVQTPGLAREIKEELVAVGVQREKIVWESTKSQILID